MKRFWVVALCLGCSAVGEDLFSDRMGPMDVAAGGGAMEAELEPPEELELEQSELEPGLELEPEDETDAPAVELESDSVEVLESRNDLEDSDPVEPEPEGEAEPTNSPPPPPPDLPSKEEVCREEAETYPWLAPERKGRNWEGQRLCGVRDCGSDGLIRYAGAPGALLHCEGNSGCEFGGEPYLCSKCEEVGPDHPEAWRAERVFVGCPGYPVEYLWCEQFYLDVSPKWGMVRASHGWACRIPPN